MGTGDRGLKIGADGSVHADEATRGELAAQPGRYRRVPAPPGLLILQRQQGAEGASRVLMSGEVVGPTTMLEIINMIANNGWRGELTLCGEHDRQLGFDQGALKWAFSRAPRERLGEVMTALGALTEDQLATCLLSNSKHKRIGEIVVEKGFLTGERVFALLRSQAQHIFEQAVQVSSGHYVFSQPPEEEEGHEAQLHLPVQGLLMQSVQRIDEMTLLREQIPNGEVCPRLTDKASRVSFEEGLRPLALLCNGQRSIVQMARRLRMDEFEATKMVAQLLKLGVAEIVQGGSLDEDKVRDMVQCLNEVMHMILDTVDRHEGASELIWTVKAWVRDTQLREYFSTALGDDAMLDADAMVERVTAMRSDRWQEALHQASHELVSFALYSAAGALPRHAEKTLVKRVNRRLSTLSL